MARTGGFSRWVAAALLAAALVAAIGFAPAPARAGDVSGLGEIQDVDLDERTVQIGNRVLALTRESVLLDERGRAIGLAVVEGAVGERAVFAGRSTRVGVVLDRLQLARDDD